MSIETKDSVQRAAARWHLTALATVVLAAAFLRFWWLGLKPLWLDEIITILVALGRTQADVPIGTVIPLDAVVRLFRMSPDASWGLVTGILQDRSVEHTHPPLFYLILHTWLGWTTPHLSELAWAARAPAGVFGVGSVLALYGLGRTAFSQATGLLAAAMCAVSPLMVAISLEARNYTLPLFWLVLAVWAGVAMAQEFQARGHVRPRLWAAWAVTNTLALYGHYYAAIAFAAQVPVLAWVCWRSPIPTGHPARARRRAAVGLAMAIGAVVLAFLPWASTLWWHLRTPELGWLDRDTVLPGLMPLLRGPMQMFIWGRLETDSPGLFVGWGLTAIAAACWLAWVTVRGTRRLLARPDTRGSTMLLLGFLLCLAVQFLASGVVMRKNLLAAPRYHFVFYPAICVLVAASLREMAVGLAPAASPSRRAVKARAVRTGVVLAVGLVGTLAVLTDHAMPKPFRPRDVADGIAAASTGPMLVAVGENTLHEVCVGLAYAIELALQAPRPAPLTFALVRRATSSADRFMRRPADPSQIWRSLAALPSVSPVEGVWVIGSGLARRDFPNDVSVGEVAGGGGLACRLDRATMRDSDERGRVTSMSWAGGFLGFRAGVPYALYRCAAGGNVAAASGSPSAAPSHGDATVPAVR